MIKGNIFFKLIWSFIHSFPTCFSHFYFGVSKVQKVLKAIGDATFFVIERGTVEGMAIQ
jgi:hypothetical protein